MTREELLKYRLDGSKSFPFHIKEQEITDKYGVYSTGVFKYKGMSFDNCNRKWVMAFISKC